MNTIILNGNTPKKSNNWHFLCTEQKNYPLEELEKHSELEHLCFLDFFLWELFLELCFDYFLCMLLRFLEHISQFVICQSEPVWFSSSLLWFCRFSLSSNRVLFWALNEAGERTGCGFLRTVLHFSASIAQFGWVFFADFFPSLILLASWVPIRKSNFFSILFIW